MKILKKKAKPSVSKEKKVIEKPNLRVLTAEGWKRRQKKAKSSK